MSSRSLKLVAALILSVSATVRAEDWPQWRGPNRNGITEASDWTSQWPEQGPKIAWQAQVGLGFSSMVVGDGRLFTAGHDDEKDTVFCFDAATGKEIWKHSYPSEIGAKYYEGGTTGTPTIDGDKVYWLGRWGDLFCFEAATGKIVWNKNIQKETGAPIPDWGFTGAPLAYKNLLILNVGDAGTAVEKETGKIVWQSAKKNAGYSTPLPFKEDDKTLVVLGSAQNYVAVDPETGKEAWRTRWVTQYGVNAADPILVQDKMFLSTGYGKGAGLFDLGDGEPTEIWKSKVLRTQLNPGVFYKGHVYGIDGDTTDKARLKCIEFETGKEKWVEQGIGTGGLILADGKMILLTAQGELMVAPATPDGFKPISRTQVLGGKNWTAPILANGRIYCRNQRGQVVCVDVRKK